MATAAGPVCVADEGQKPRVRRGLLPQKGTPRACAVLPGRAGQAPAAGRMEAVLWYTTELAPVRTSAAGAEAAGAFGFP